jgi:Uma2 family endonuclease
MTTMLEPGRATIEDLLRMPEDGNKYELVDGEILMSPTGFRHSAVGMKIGYFVMAYLEERPIGYGFAADVGVHFPNGNVRSPDFTYVGAEKLPGGEMPETYGKVIPDLAVEVLSPSDSMTQVGRKIGEYFEQGVPLVWLVDPKKKTVTVYRSLTDAKQLTVDDVLTAEPVLPGFAVPVRSIF